MESIIFNVTLISFLIPIILTTVRPHPFQIKATISAKRQGYSMPLILITRALPYLTIYTQFWILLALYKLEPITMSIAKTLSWSVFFLYHGINYVDPMYLAYHSKELVREVVRWTPPFSRYIVIWFGLHLQHTIFPFYLHYLAKIHSISSEKFLINTTNSMSIMILYLAWHLFCWDVQGIPAYPFLSMLRSTGYEISFYFIGFMFMLLINVIIL